MANTIYAEQLVASHEEFEQYASDFQTQHGEIGRILKDIQDNLGNLTSTHFSSNAGFEFLQQAVQLVNSISRSQKKLEDHFEDIRKAATKYNETENKVKSEAEKLMNKYPNVF